MTFQRPFRSFACGVIVASMIGTSADAMRCAAAPPVEEPTADSALDPALFLQQLIDRYHLLEIYEDSAQVSRVTERNGAETHRVDTAIECSIDATGESQVRTPSKELPSMFGLAIPFKSSPGMERVRERYEYWLAPHLMFKYSDEPLSHFHARSSDSQNLRVTRATDVVVEEKSMLRLEFESTDNVDDSCVTKVDLYVNRESMLIERIEGSETFDGGKHTTTVDIRPVYTQTENIETIAGAQDVPIAEQPIEQPEPTLVEPMSPPLH